MEKISVVIISKNEEANIKDCVQSVSGFDEIIVIDDFSSDRTALLAKKAGARIFQRKFDNFAGQKNFGIGKARNKWIMSIDADERVTPSLFRELKKCVFDKDGYYVPIKNYFLGKWLKRGAQYPDLHLRLFKKSRGRFALKVINVHESVNIENSKTGKLVFPLEHYSYREIKAYFAKFNKYTMLEAEGKFENSKKPSIYGIFLRPFNRFLKWYIIKLGILDGMRGLLFHSFSAFYLCVVELKLLALYGFRTRVLKWKT